MTDRRVGFVRRVFGVALSLLLTTGAVAGAQTASDVRLQDVSVTTQPDSVTVIVKTSGEAKYQAELMDRPSRLVIDFENTTYAWRKTPLTATEPAPAAAAQAAPAEPARVAQAPAAPATPPAPAPVLQAPPVTNGARLISLDFKDADVVNLLRILAAESGRNVVIGEDVKGKMSITLRNVPWDLALDTIMEARGPVKVERDNVLRIVSSDQLAKERESRAKLEEAKVKSETEIRTKLAGAKLKEQEAATRQLAAEQAAAEQAARGPLKEETIRLSYADAEEVARTLEGILGLQEIGRAHV